MGDEAVKIFLNAGGTMNDVSSELKAFLDYVAGQKTEDPYVERLEEAVQEAKKNREWRHEYMTLLMRDQENREIGRQEGITEGIAEGREEGEDKMLVLVQKLLIDKRFSEIDRMKEDKDYRLILYREYHIS